MIFRNDDVCANTTNLKMQEIYGVIKDLFPYAEIMTCASIYCVRNPVYAGSGALYPDLPLKDKSNEYLYTVNAHIIDDGRLTNTVASHGLFHVKHGDLPEEAQKMSIIGSCSYLRTKKFVAPFNSYNEITQKVCDDNGIELITAKYDWKSLEHNDFDSNHKYWYFHSWRWDIKDFKEKLIKDVATINS